ncbi:hypothetical protein J3E64_001761 [Sphingobium sp. OAS761]|uniref:hypothetical protein n=1 Tax=Sphingobium sp. OAS761 TaxID=2817901 RepID=UPI00209DB608|nr:hypothetical protein [Sphingobium sp. OAS761]MCP1470074.1 hypothetical protein [Sphingobium sp. OAS761]
MPAASPDIPLLSQHDGSLEAALFGELTQHLGKSWSATIGARAYLARVDNEQVG